MASTPRILFLSMEAPRMPGSGGEVRSWFFAEALAEIGGLTMVCLGGFSGGAEVDGALAGRCAKVLVPARAGVDRSAPPRRGAAWLRSLGALLLPWRGRWQRFLEYHLQYRRIPSVGEASSFPWSRRFLARAFQIEYALLSRLVALPPAAVVLFRRHFEALRPQLEELAREGATFDWIWVEHSLMFPFAEELRSLFPQAALACNAHNVESVLHDRIARSSGDPQDRRYERAQARLLARMERRAFAACRLVVACSEEDAGQVRRLAPAVRCFVIGNGVDTAYFRRRAETARAAEATVLFTGTFGYGPNREGLVWFLREVWPLVRRERPDCRFVAAGRGAGEAVRALAPNLPGVGALSDPEDMRPAFEEAWVVAVPLLAGGGTRLKIFEAMAMECPVVSTPLGAEGIALKPGDHALIAEGAAEFARALVDLIADAGRRDRMAGEALTLVRERYEWSRLTESLGAVLAEAPAIDGTEPG